MADASAEDADDHARAAASQLMKSVADLREFMREPLRRVRAEMCERGTKWGVGDPHKSFVW